MSGSSSRTGPLASLRVVELAGLGPAPFAAMVLADLGADVIRIDRPAGAPAGFDPNAAMRDDEADGPVRNPYDVLNRNRDGVGIDLREAEGRELVHELCGSADVLLEGFRPGVAERLGVGPDELLAANPSLVYGRMTGWGQEGPLAERVGHDLNYLSLSGGLAHIGRAGQPPTPPLNLVADFGGGGMLLAMGVLAALVERGSSGRGQVVDAAMVDGAALLMAPLFGAAASGFWSDQRGTNLLDSGAPFYDVYECGDGRWISLGAIEAPFFAAALDGFGLVADELPDQHDTERWPELREAIAAAVRTRSRDEWAEVFADRDACVAPVLTMAEAPDHPHATERGAFPLVDGVPQPGPAPRFSRTPPDPVPRPAVTGVDPVEVLGRWGIDADRVGGLTAAGTVTPTR